MNKVHQLSPNGAGTAELWARLVAAPDIAAARDPWLEMACRQIGGVEQGLLFDRLGDAGHRVTATWPAGRPVEAELELLAREAIDERRGLVSLPEGPDGTLQGGCHLAYPISIGDFVHGAVAVALTTDQHAAINEAMRSLQWSLGWLRDFLQQRVIGAAGAEAGAATLALEGIADMIGPASFGAAGHTLATRLVARFDLERVSIGFLKGGAASVSTISNSASFGRRMHLVRLIEQAMDEAIDQERAILHPPAGDGADTIRRAHDKLAQEVGGNALLTIPLMRDGAMLGAILCESAQPGGFSQRDVDALNAVAAFAGPILLMRREQDRNILLANLAAARRGLAGLFGPRHLKAKLIVGVILAVLAAVSLIRTDYQITADAALEAALQRAIVAPHDGFVVAAPLRAGDRVAQGQLVAALDDRERALEALYWQSERQQRLLEYDRALGERDLGQLSVIKAQIEQAEVRLRMIEAQLEQSQLHAPIEGIVASGDLSQSIGTAVARGDVLFEIAPLDAYRLMLHVDESQIGQVAPGMSGSFLSTSLPGVPVSFEVTRITPVALPREGRTVFRVEAEIDRDMGELRPGMRGVGKIHAGEASLAWVWTRGFRDWARMATWSWLP